MLLERRRPRERARARARERERGGGGGGGGGRARQTGRQAERETLRLETSASLAQAVAARTDHLSSSVASTARKMDASGSEKFPFPQYSCRLRSPHSPVSERPAPLQEGFTLARTLARTRERERGRVRVHAGGRDLQDIGGAAAFRAFDLIKHPVLHGVADGSVALGELVLRLPLGIPAAMYLLPLHHMLPAHNQFFAFAPPYHVALEALFSELCLQPLRRSHPSVVYLLAVDQAYQCLPRRASDKLDLQKFVAEHLFSLLPLLAEGLLQIPHKLIDTLACERVLLNEYGLFRLRIEDGEVALVSDVPYTELSAHAVVEGIARLHVQWHLLCTNTSHARVHSAVLVHARMCVLALSLVYTSSASTGMNPYRVLRILPTHRHIDRWTDIRR